jgi:hypothetical protein
MKLIGNFTQTYTGSVHWTPGSDCKNRDFLIDAFCNDKNKINCYNLLDYQTFSFHNMELSHAQKLNNQIKTALPKIKGVCYNDTTLGNCILTHLLFLKKQGMTDFLWIQDDEFFTHTNFNDFRYFLDFYKNNSDIKNVSLLYPVSEFSILESKDVRKIPNTELEISCFFPTELKQVRPYSMDFTAFICNIDYFLTKMFDSSFTNIRDAYQLEGAVLHKSASNNVERRFLNIKFFDSFNIVGMGGSLSQATERLETLKQLKLL